MVASYDSHLPGYVGVTCQEGAPPTNVWDSTRMDGVGFWSDDTHCSSRLVPWTRAIFVRIRIMFSLGRVFDFRLMIDRISRQIDSEYVGSSSRCRVGAAEFESSSASTCVLGWRGTMYSDSAQPLTTVSEELLSITSSRYIDRYILICAWCSIYIYSLNSRPTNHAVEQGVFTFLPPRQMGA